MIFPAQESDKLQSYLRDKFGNQNITLSPRAKAEDSVEVSINGEFIGIIYKDTDEGETSYDFNMAILDIDLP